MTSIGGLAGPSAERTKHQCHLINQHESDEPPVVLILSASHLTGRFWMLRRSIMGIGVLLVGVLISAGAQPVAMAAAQQQPRIMITMIYYDSPGRDTRTNASLNAEYLVLRNTTARRMNLYRWTVRDANRHVHRFNGTFFLQPGRSVVLHTGRGTNRAGHQYWGMRNYVWNNTGDTAFLRGPTGLLVDRCTYPGGRPGYVRC